MLRPEMLAFLPVVTKTRELEARVLMAAHLVKRGFSVVLGDPSFVDYRARHARNAVCFSPLLVPAAEKRLIALKARGHTIIAWDEEGLVYPDPQWYFSNRVGAGPAKLADALIAWGDQAASDWLMTLPANAHLPLPLGNGRLDLLRFPYRELYSAKAEELKDRYGVYALVNTNFDLINHADGEGGLLKRLRAGGRIRDGRDEEKFALWGEFRQAMFDAFMVGLPALHEALPHMNFVIRPHPSEDVGPYRELAARHERIFVEPANDPVFAWIIGAQAIIHNSCTTAVEAFMLETPPLAYVPPHTPGMGMDSPLPNLLSIQCESWDEIIERLRMLPAESRHAWITPAQLTAAKGYIGSLEGDHSVSRLAELAFRMAEAKPPARLGRPPFARRFKRKLGHAADAAGLRQRVKPDDQRRFPGIGKNEMAALAASIGNLAGVTLKTTEIEPSTYLIEERC
ncbi:surface carbohydrate biosynthesis protein [Novosphingobium sp. AP12]|uniref:surface carbohydrate biosynthesis protein n=1 Tax=Novosphingobium sp. AP12 TaxID=1144305 RepID=UPI0002720FFF|nr:surface carbohydrate biosynthesis protein [Novosphingobium sp. AP12]EJL28327.1 hypothetical protein PMI02_02627 [Novosphingobium sp. AP12]